MTGQTEICHSYKIPDFEDSVCKTKAKCLSNNVLNFGLDSKMIVFWMY